MDINSSTISSSRPSSTPQFKRSPVIRKRLHESLLLAILTVTRYRFFRGHIRSRLMLHRLAHPALFTVSSLPSLVRLFRLFNQPIMRTLLNICTRRRSFRILIVSLVNMIAPVLCPNPLMSRLIQRIRLTGSNSPSLSNPSHRCPRSI